MNNKSALLKTNAGEYIPRRKCTLDLGTFSPRETYLGTGMFSPREYVPGYVGMFFWGQIMSKSLQIFIRYIY